MRRQVFPTALKNTNNKAKKKSVRLLENKQYNALLVLSVKHMLLKLLLSTLDIWCNHHLIRGTGVLYFHSEFTHLFSNTKNIVCGPFSRIRHWMFKSQPHTAMPYMKGEILYPLCLYYCFSLLKAKLSHDWFTQNKFLLHALLFNCFSM